MSPATSPSFLESDFIDCYVPSKDGRSFVMESFPVASVIADFISDLESGRKRRNSTVRWHVVGLDGRYTFAWRSEGGPVGVPVFSADELVRHTDLASVCVGADSLPCVSRRSFSTTHGLSTPSPSSLMVLVRPPIAPISGERRTRRYTRDVLEPLVGGLGRRRWWWRRLWRVCRLGRRYVSSLSL